MPKKGIFLQQAKSSNIWYRNKPHFIFKLGMLSCVGKLSLKFIQQTLAEQIIILIKKKKFCMAQKNIHVKKNMQN